MQTTTRRALLAACPVALVAGIAHFGMARDAASVSLAECLRDPSACVGEELYVGYARVSAVHGRRVVVRAWMGDLSLDPWPVAAPLPSPGLHVSAIATHSGGRTLRPLRVRSHPLRVFKERVGLAMVLAWLALGLWGLRRVRGAPPDA